MYPDWPRSSADLVPLPRCDGPKLNAFDFQGEQQIEFLEYVGEGTHAHVLKVQIHKRIYALKLFRFCDDDDWLTSRCPLGDEERNGMSAFYEYSEPFSCECRAFGRLQEAGHEELAIGCFGYVLLDEEHERKLRSQFKRVLFNGSMERAYGDIMGDDTGRARFLGRDGRLPPIRGIVKEYSRAPEEDELRPADMTKMLRDVKLLQQLGITSIDVAARQCVDGRISDFSTAITIPHFVTNPELNPALTDQMRAAIELNTFQLALNDYLMFDDMIDEWNDEHADSKGAITVRAFPGGRGSPVLRSYELRNKAARHRVYTYVDPRRYNWKRQKRAGKKSYRPRLRAKPPMWFYDCSDERLAARLRRQMSYSLDWDYRDGLIFPLGWAHTSRPHMHAKASDQAVVTLSAFQPAHAQAKW